MADNASIVVWTLNSVSQGKVRLRGMKSYAVKSDAKVETVNEVGSKIPTGFKRKPGGLAVTFEFYRKKGKQVPDWQKVHNNEEIIALTRQVDGGPREQFPECCVSTVDDNGDDEGENMISIEVVALEKKAL